MAPWARPASATPPPDHLSDLALHLLHAAKACEHPRAVLDEDTPGGGAFYCTPCSRYFVSEHALVEHSRTKPHKRRLKELHGAQPHRQKDAEWAAGMGAPDDGRQPKQQQAPAAAAMEL